jgi:hypothetical protein
MTAMGPITDASERLAFSANVNIAETTSSGDCETLTARGRFINYVEKAVNEASILPEVARWRIRAIVRLTCEASAST